MYKIGGSPIVHNDYLIFPPVVFNLKTGEQFFCNPKYKTTVVSNKSHIVFVKKENSNEDGFLSDFEGKLISTQSFQTVNNFNKFNQSIVSIKNPKKGNPLYGVIDKFGEWIIPPTYRKIELRNNYYVVATPDSKSYRFEGIYDSQGNILVSPDGTDLTIVKENIFIRHKMIDKKYFSDVFSLPENKLLKKDLPFHSIDYLNICDSFVLMCYNRVDNVYTIMDEDFKSIAEGISSISYDKDKISTTLKNSEGKTIKKIFICGKELNRIKFKGELIEEYQQYLKINEDLSFIQLNDSSFYFINKDKTIKLYGEIWEEVGNITSLYLADYQDFVVVQKNRKYFMVNYNGEIILPNIFTYLGRFDKESGLIRFSRGTDINGYLTQTGEILFHEKYNKVEYIGLNLFKVETEKYQGVVNRRGKVIVPLQEHFVWLNGGIVTISKNMNTLKAYSIDGEPIQ